MTRTTFARTLMAVAAGCAAGFTLLTVPAQATNENPLDCAGSYKFEMSGLSLVSKMSVSDPSSLTGLPLIALTDLLQKVPLR